MGRYVVYDCDVGNDDAWGLMMLIKAEEAYKRRAGLMDAPKKFEIIGVTCVQGNTTVDCAVVNTLRVLDTVNRNDIPVYKGCSNLLKPRPWENLKYFVGKDGFGDLEHDKPVDLSLLRPEHAVNAMYEFVCKHPKRVDFLLVGPLTNFAMSISMYGSKFLDKLGEIYIMGGNYRGKGNTTKSAEFNFMMDPEAAQIVFERVKTPVTILPWETCDDQAFRITLEWRLNTLGATESPFVQLLNRVERALLVPRGVQRWLVCDALAVAVYLFPHLVVVEHQLVHAAVELAGVHTRGQMVIDHLRRELPNAKIITNINIDCYQKIIAWTGGLRGVHMENELGKSL